MKWSFIFLFLLLSMCGFAQSKTDYKAVGAPVPPFSIVRAVGGKITNTVLKKGNPVMLMIFSPQCDHCERMLDTLKGMAGNFKKTQLLLVCEARNKGFLKDFVKKTELAKYPAFGNAGWDGGNLIYDLYTYQLLPQVNVYGANHKLVRTFTGVFPMDSLRQFIQ